MTNGRVIPLLAYEIGTMSENMLQQYHSMVDSCDITRSYFSLRRLRAFAILLERLQHILFE